MLIIVKTKERHHNHSLTHFKVNEHPGQVVQLAGVPGKTQDFDLRQKFKSYNIDFKPNLNNPIVRLQIPEEKFQSTSKYNIRFDSISEAYRFYRDVHLTYWNDSDYLMYAKIIY